MTQSGPARAGEIPRLVRTLDDDANPLHADITPSVRRLMELGVPAAVAVLDLLEAPDPVTRLHAQRVIEGVVMYRNGWVPNRGYASLDAEQETRRLLQANGGYRYDAPPEERAAAVRKWRAWLSGAAEEDARSGRGQT